jgi:hypothetical protein
LEADYPSQGVNVARRITGQAKPGSRSGDIAGLFYPLILLYSLIYSLTEKFLLEQSELTWVLILTTLLYLTPRRLPAVRRSPVPAHVYGHAANAGEAPPGR